MLVSKEIHQNLQNTKNGSRKRGMYTCIKVPFSIKIMFQCYYGAMA